MQNSVEIFSIALVLIEPWYVKEVVFDKERLQLDVYLGFKKGHLFLADDNQYYTAYDTVERRWEPPLPREMKFDEVNPFAWHLINKKAFTIFDKKKK